MSLSEWGTFIESFDSAQDARRFIIKRTAWLRGKGLNEGVQLKMHAVKAAASKKWYYSVYLERQCEKEQLSRASQAT